MVFATRLEAKVIDVVPRAGWTAAIRQEKAETAIVTFTNQAQRNRYVRVTASWSNGPVAEYAETVVLPA